MKEKEIEIAKTFSDRLFEICLLKNISQTELINKLSNTFKKQWLENCFNGLSLPNDVLLVTLSKLLDKSVDYFFEKGERITDKNILILVNRDKKIKQLESILSKNITYTADNYKTILTESVKEALDKELISFSKAAALLDTSVENIRKGF